MDKALNNGELQLQLHWVSRLNASKHVPSIPSTPSTKLLSQTLSTESSVKMTRQFIRREEQTPWQSALADRVSIAATIPGSTYATIVPVSCLSA